MPKKRCPQKPAKLTGLILLKSLYFRKYAFQSIFFKDVDTPHMGSWGSDLKMKNRSPDWARKRVSFQVDQVPGYRRCLTFLHPHVRVKTPGVFDQTGGHRHLNRAQIEVSRKSGAGMCLDSGFLGLQFTCFFDREMAGMRRAWSIKTWIKKISCDRQWRAAFRDDAGGGIWKNKNFRKNVKACTKISGKM